MAWSFSYMFSSFVSPLPWVKEGKTDVLTKEEEDANLWNEDYFYKEVLQMSEGID